MRTTRGLAIAVVSACALGGCASNRAAPEARTPDFTMHVLIFPRESGRRTVIEPWEEPQSFLLEPGGSLRALFGPGALTSRYPPLARRLDAAEMDLLYGLTRDADLFNPDHPARISAIETYQPNAGAGVIGAFDIRSDGDVNAVAIDLRRDARARAIVKRLTRLTWRHGSE